MKTVPEAEALARAMADIGTACERRVTAVLTNMDIPLGCAVGNAMEVAEAAEVLRGGGPADLRAVSLELAAHMVNLALHIPLSEARRQAAETVDSGAAFAKLKEWIAAQGGDTAVIDDPDRFPKSPIVRPVTARQSGFITAMNTEAIGEASVVLGAGRAKAEDEIDPAAGIEILRKNGDRVEAGDVLAILHTASEDRFADAARRYAEAIEIGGTPPAEQTLIYSVIRGAEE